MTNSSLSPRDHVGIISLAISIVMWLMTIGLYIKSYIVYKDYYGNTSGLSVESLFSAPILSPIGMLFSGNYLTALLWIVVLIGMMISFCLGVVGLFRADTKHYAILGSLLSLGGILLFLVSFIILLHVFGKT